MFGSPAQWRCVQSQGLGEQTGELSGLRAEVAPAKLLSASALARDAAGVESQAGADA